MARARVTSRLIYAMTGAHHVVGGIAMVNRSALPALAALAAERGVPLSVISLHEASHSLASDTGTPIEVTGCRGSKVRFVREVYRHAGRRTRYFFDHITLANCALPIRLLGWGRLIVLAHGSESWRRVRWLSCHTFRIADAVLANSNFTAARMRACIPGVEVQACPLGLPGQLALNPEPGSDRARNAANPLGVPAADGQRRTVGTRCLMLVGRLHPQEREKGHDQLIDILPRLVEADTDVQLLFVGGGEDSDRLRARALSAGVADRVLMPGHVDADALRRMYGHAYAYVMPSRQEGFGLVYLEAMNYGLPCIASRHDGGGDVVVHGETGWLIEDPADRDELLQASTRLLVDPARAARMGMAGHARLRANFTEQAFQARLRQAVEPLL